MKLVKVTWSCLTFYQVKTCVIDGFEIKNKMRS